TSSLAAGETLKIPVTWAPTQAGDSSAQLVIESNDPMQPKITVPITTHATPVASPIACINVLSVTQRQYAVNPNGGPPLIQHPAVPTSVWRDADPNAKVIHVRPGMKITFTSQRVHDNPMTHQPEVDMQAEQNNPCTADPQQAMLTSAWTLTSRPADSGA